MYWAIEILGELSTGLLHLRSSVLNATVQPQTSMDVDRALLTAVENVADRYIQWLCVHVVKDIQRYASGSVFI